MYIEFAFIQENYNSYQFKYIFFLNKSKIYNQSAYHAHFYPDSTIYEYIIYFPMSAITSVKHFTKFKD